MKRQQPTGAADVRVVGNEQLARDEEELFQVHFLDDSPTHLQVLRVIGIEQADSNQLVDQRNDVLVVATLHFVDENVLLLSLTPTVHSHVQQDGILAETPNATQLADSRFLFLEEGLTRFRRVSHVEMGIFFGRFIHQHVPDSFRLLGKEGVSTPAISHAI